MSPKGHPKSPLAEKPKLQRKGSLPTPTNSPNVPAKKMRMRDPLAIESTLCHMTGKHGKVHWNYLITCVGETTLRKKIVIAVVLVTVFTNIPLLFNEVISFDESSCDVLTRSGFANFFPAIIFVMNTMTIFPLFTYEMAKTRSFHAIEHTTYFFEKTLTILSINTFILSRFATIDPYTCEALNPFIKPPSAERLSIAFSGFSILMMVLTIVFYNIKREHKFVIVCEAVYKYIGRYFTLLLLISALVIFLSQITQSSMTFYFYLYTYITIILISGYFKFYLIIKRLFTSMTSPSSKTLLPLHAKPYEVTEKTPLHKRGTGHTHSDEKSPTGRKLSKFAPSPFKKMMIKKIMNP
jgi:hypothetical protein